MDEHVNRWIYLSKLILYSIFEKIIKDGYNDIRLGVEPVVAI